MLRISCVFLFATTIVAAPVPKDSPRPSAQTVRQAIGKSHLSKEMRAVGRNMGEDPVIHYEFWNQDVRENVEEKFFSLRWKSKGLELAFCHSVLHTAWMFNDKASDYKRYVGELPEELSFDNDITAVEKKLGKPEVTFRLPVDEPEEKVEVKIDYIYKKKGACVSFRKSPKGDSVITAVAMFPPGDAPSWVMGVTPRQQAPHPREALTGR